MDIVSSASHPPNGAGGFIPPPLQSPSQIRLSRRPGNGPERDFKVEWFSGTGKGGQHRNKHQNCCRVTHLPSGLVQTATGRERTSNLRSAMEQINQRLDAQAAGASLAKENTKRRSQVGSGMRGDKRRTYRFRDDHVTDHQTGRSARCTEVMRGRFDLLW